MIGSTSGSPFILFLLLRHKRRNRSFLFFFHLLLCRHTDILLQLPFIMPASLFQIRNTDLHRNLSQILIRINKRKSLLNFLLHRFIADPFCIPAPEHFLLHLISSLQNHLFFRHLPCCDLPDYKLRHIIVNPLLPFHQNTILTQQFFHCPVPCQRRQHKRPVIFRLHPHSQWQQFFLLIQKTGQRNHQFLHFSNRSRQKQLLLRSGHGNIKHSQFLTQALLQKLPPHNLLIQRRGNNPFLRDHRIHTHPKFRMKQKPRIHILKIKLFSHSCHKNHRKLQTFALMDRHNLYRRIPGTCQIHLTIIYLIRLKLFNITDKIKQSSIAGFLIIHRLFHKHGQIRITLLPSRKRPRIISISRFLKYKQNQLMNRRIGSHLSHPFQQIQKTSQLSQFLIFSGTTSHRNLSCIRQIPVPCKSTFLRSDILHNTLIQHPLWILNPQLCQLLRTASHDRRTQHSHQRNILQRVITHLQII